MTDIAIRQTPPANGAVIVPADPITLGNILAASGYFTDSEQGAQAAVKVMAGQELGFGAIASMTGINVIKGRVTLSANLMAAAVKRSARYDFVVREHTDQVCTIDYLRDGAVFATSTFTMDDAKTAGLTDGNWRKYPRNMLYARAMSNGAKWHCPDVFAGAPVYTADELGAEIDGETGDMIPQPVTVPQLPVPAVAVPVEPAPQPPEPAPVDAVVVEPQPDPNRLLTADQAARLATACERAPAPAVRMELIALGVADTSDIGAALATLTVAQARVLAEAIDARGLLASA